MPPSYVLPNDLKPATTPTGASSEGVATKISQGNEVVNNINGLLTNANKFMDNLTVLLNRKVQGTDNISMEAQVEAKAHKLMEQKAQFSNEEIILKQPPQEKRKEPKIIVYRDMAVTDLIAMIGSIDQKKTIKQYVEGELKQLEELGMIHSAVEQFILKHVGLEYEN